MAPEALLEKDTDPRADIFSVGVILSEAVSGRHPFLAGSFMATSDRTLHEVPPPLARLNPKVPAELGRIVAKMLAKNPDERYATAADLLVDMRAVQRAVAHPAALPTRDDSTRGARGWIARNKGKIFVAALGLLLIISIGLLSQVRQRFHWFDKAIAGPKNVAVLPFQAIGGAPENQAFSDGITEALTVKLMQLTATHQLQVAPGREVRARRISSPEEARKELGASLILEGTVYRSGNTVRVNYALVDTSTRRQIRAGTITADASDPFAVQDRVADGVVRMLQLELNPKERRALQVHGTQVAGAYDFYLQGSGYLQNYDRVENLDNAIQVFEGALALDPNYALAYAGLGKASSKKYESSKEPRWVQSSRRDCERALSLNSGLPAAHVCLGTLYKGTGAYQKAVREFERALEAEPTSDEAFRGLADAYERLGKPAEAEKTYRRAIELRPHYWAGYSWLGVFYYHQARYAEAAEMFKQVVALVPDSFRGYSNLGAVYVQQGRYQDSIVTLERSVSIRPTGPAHSNLATAYFHQRRFADAARNFEEAVKLDERNYELWRNLVPLRRRRPGGRTDPRPRGGDPARPRGHPREQRRDQPLGVGAEDHAGGLATDPDGERDRPVPVHPGVPPGNARAGLGARGEHRIRRGAPRRQVHHRVQRIEARGGRPYPLGRRGGRGDGCDRQCGLPWIRGHGHDAAVGQPHRGEDRDVARGRPACSPRHHRPAPPASAGRVGERRARAVPRRRE